MQTLKLIDSHFHLPFIAERGLSVEESVASIVAGIDIGTVFDDLDERSAIVRKVLDSCPNVKIFMSGGMGPWETAGRNHAELEELFRRFVKNAEEYPVGFIGECGFDFHYHEYGNEDLQRHLFDLNARFALEQGKKIIIHSRDAENATLKAIKAYPGLNGIIHCFSGSTTILRAALDLGYYISYAGNITYKSNSALRDTLHLVPMDRILLETDAPYLSPVPKRGQPNTSKHIIYTYECVAEVLGKKVEELSEQVFENFSMLTQNFPANHNPRGHQV